MTYPKIDRNSRLPLYMQIADFYKKLIINKELKPGDILPSDNDLVEKLGVALLTTRAAMDILVQEGLIYRAKGKGTFISFPRFPRTVQLINFTEDILSRALKLETSILFMGKVDADEEIASRLDIELYEKVIRIYRLRKIDGIPSVVHNTFLHPSIDFSQEELEENQSSIYFVFNKKIIIPKFSNDTFEAISAIGEVQKLLELQKGSPLLLLTRLTYDIHNLPIEYTKAFYRSDLYRFSVRVERQMQS